MTKLTKFEKAQLKDIKAEYPNVKFGNAGRLTVIAEPTGPGRGKFAIAIASNGEGKIRRKVGEFKAYRRLVETEGMPFEFDTWDNFFIEDFASELEIALQL